MMSLCRAFSGLVLLLALAEQPALACWAAPPGHLIGVDEQIADAKNIAVVKVVSATPTADGQIKYEFLVQKRLAGEEHASFALLESDAKGVIRDTSFDRHNDPAFWAFGGGRLTNYVDCKLYPWFVAGASYLLFDDALQTRRSAEKIDTIGMSFDREDKWLLYVEGALEKRRQRELGQPN
ncbi:hypothetical protein GCM10027321_01080 [Massilia terrae]|uniref:Lipoprotein n=1 Tax=Massilia terrae TaxID=1811224 RepID=A0ABT2CU66_9BURK|nr:hypothetical protein [Massilia terrae]MCS0657528.1 hypothetical protein [Massilia terrae]